MVTPLAFSIGSPGFIDTWSMPAPVTLPKTVPDPYEEMLL
jgi:hypothetical protein